jgi:hypothetical protein
MNTETTYKNIQNYNTIKQKKVNYKFARHIRMNSPQDLRELTFKYKFLKSNFHF